MKQILLWNNSRKSNVHEHIGAKFCLSQRNPNFGCKAHNYFGCQEDYTKLWGRTNLNTILYKNFLIIPQNSQSFPHGPIGCAGVGKRISIRFRQKALHIL